MNQLSSLRDSKKLTQKKRQQFLALFNNLIKLRELHSALGIASSQTIDKYGVTSATGRAMRAALRSLSRKTGHVPNHTLVDAFHIRYLPKRDHTPIKKGDEQSITIAAASIIAKEYRDGLMRRYAKQKSLSIYGWETNVGYGTKRHQEAIRQFGICPLHRRLFVPHYLLG